MTSKRIPIQAAKDVAKKYKLKQVVMILLDEQNISHVVTYGKTLEDCYMAAESGNNIKRHMGFPEELCNEVPRRIKNRSRTP